MIKDNNFIYIIFKKNVYMKLWYGQKLIKWNIARGVQNYVDEYYRLI